MPSAFNMKTNEKKRKENADGIWAEGFLHGPCLSFLSSFLSSARHQSTSFSFVIAWRIKKEKERKDIPPAGQFLRLAVGFILNNERLAKETLTAGMSFPFLFLFLAMGS